MKHILPLIILVIVSAANAMQKDSKKEFYLAITKKRYAIALDLLDKNKTLANADFTKFCKEHHDETGDNETPLLASIRDRRPSLALFKGLLEAGADINKASRTQQTPLLKAIFTRNVTFALLLLEKGANTSPRITVFRDGTLDALELADSMHLTMLVKIINENRDAAQKLAHATTPSQLEAIHS